MTFFLQITHEEFLKRKSKKRKYLLTLKLKDIEQANWQRKAKSFLTGNKKYFSVYLSIKNLNKMAAASTTWEIMANWIDKADKSENPFDQFICYWIAFNCYYGSVAKLDSYSDRKAINQLIDDKDVNAMFDTIIADSGNKAYWDELVRISPVTDEKTGVKKHGKLVKFNYQHVIAELIYQVRNNLFHGDKGLNSTRDREVVLACIPIMKQFTKKLYLSSPNL